MPKIKILLCGVAGAMGKEVIAAAENSDEITIAAGFDKAKPALPFPTYDNLSDIKEDVDTVVDFSHKSVSDDIVNWCVKNNKPLVSAVTGLSEESESLITKAAESIPVFRAANFSYGVAVMNRLLSEAVKLLASDFDIELIEAHHNRKADAPSGTAKNMLNLIDKAANNVYDKKYGRCGNEAKRAVNEIGVHSIRGGTIAGEHSVIFAGNDEILTISHSAGSRRIFAYGAFKAAHFIVEKQKGLYSMEDIV